MVPLERGGPGRYERIGRRRLRKEDEQPGKEEQRDSEQGEPALSAQAHIVAEEGSLPPGSAQRPDSDSVDRAVLQVHDRPGLFFGCAVGGAEPAGVGVRVSGRGSGRGLAEWAELDGVAGLAGHVCGVGCGVEE